MNLCFDWDMKRENRESWSSLPPEVQRKLIQAAKQIEFKRGQYIYQAGDTPQGLYFVEKGLVGIVIYGLSGKEHLLRFFMPGQFFGHRSLFSQEEYHATTVCLDSTFVRFVPQATVFEILNEHPSLYLELAQTLAKELRRCELQRVMILENQILPRAAQALIYLKDLHPDHNWTRQEIANFCASTVSTIIKALAKLESMNLIRQEGRVIEILDREGLLSLQEQE